MKRLPLILALATATPALAQQAPPATLILPSETVQAVRTYLGHQPHDDVAALVNALVACVQVQIPDAQGRIQDRGQCPPVTAALHPAKAEPAPQAPAEPPAK